MINKGKIKDNIKFHNYAIKLYMQKGYQKEQRKAFCGSLFNAVNIHNRRTNRGKFHIKPPNKKIHLFPMLDH